MRRALAEAERGRGAVEPNPMVGAVVVRDGKAVGVGHHAFFGGPHAEVNALREAGEAARGATLYVTLEPCCHQGKTPPCTDGVIAAGIGRVVVAMADPFPKVDGGGIALLKKAGIAVDLGIDTAKARRLNAPYLKRLETALPFVTAKWAMTLDGKIATASGQSAWISGPRSRALVHELRGRVDAILVGIGTALADDPMLTARPPGPRTPARVVLDSAGRLPLTGKLARSAREVPVWLAVTEKAPIDRVEKLEELGCEILKVSADQHGNVSILPLLKELGRRGLTNLLVEGGSQVLGAFLDARQIDAVDVFIAPIIAGGRHAFAPIAGLGVASMNEAFRLVEPEISMIDGDARVQGLMPWALAALSQDSPQGGFPPI